MKKILVFLNSFNYGGVTSLIQDIYRNIDRTKYKMDFIRLDWNRNEFDNEITENGDTVFYINNILLNKIPVLNYAIRRRNMIAQIKHVIGRKEKYDVAYIHANADYAVPAAQKLGIPIVIMHSHEAVGDFKGDEKKSRITAYLWKHRQKMYNRDVTYKVGDSLKACVAKFGDGIIGNQNMKVITPPINFDRFNPDNYLKRDPAISSLIPTNTFNLIHVGRITNVKNQGFMIEILAELNKVLDCRLFIVGDGDTSHLTDRAKELKVLDEVVFLPGNTSPEIYKYMNCSLLPSFSEAFGMVAVESQLMGVPCFASTNVPEDVDIGMCSFLELEKGALGWATEIAGYDYENKSINEECANSFRIERKIEILEELFEGKM